MSDLRRCPFWPTAAVAGVALLAGCSWEFQLWPFVVAGVSDGAAYALAAIGLVLTYKASGVFNFAIGAQAAVSAYVFYSLRETAQLPWPVAAVVAILLVGVAGSLVLERLASQLADAPPVMKVVAAIGLLVFLQSLLTAIYGPQTILFGQYLPSEGIDIGGVYVSGAQMITTGIVLVATVALGLFFGRSRLGAAMHAVVEDSLLLSLYGTNPSTVRRVAWAIGSSFTAISGILLAPSIGIDVNAMLLVYIAAFGAAAVGGFTSLPITFFAAIAIGIIQDIMSYKLGSSSSLFVANLPSQVPFVALVGALLLLPRTRLVERGAHRVRYLAPARMFSRKMSAAGAAVIVAAAIAVPFVVAEFQINQWTTAVALALVLGSISLLLRTSGQISLCQIAFAAVGATTFARLLSVGVPWLVALLLAGLIAIPVGAIVAIPSFRLSGVYLAVVTFGVGLLFQNMIYGSILMFGTGLQLNVPRPSFGTSDRSYYFVVLAIAIMCFGLIVAINASRLGRLMKALGDSPAALEAHGTDTRVLRLYAFCLSAFVAAIGGALLASVTQAISGDLGGPYSYLNSAVLVAVLFCCGQRLILSAVIAAIAFEVLKSYSVFTDIVPTAYQAVLFGASAIAVATVPNLNLVFKRAKRLPASSDLRIPEPEDELDAIAV